MAHSSDSLVFDIAMLFYNLMLNQLTKSFPIKDLHLKNEVLKSTCLLQIKEEDRERFRTECLELFEEMELYNETKRVQEGKLLRKEERLPKFF
jgi:hypothetical protein